MMPQQRRGGRRRRSRNSALRAVVLGLMALALVAIAWYRWRGAGIAPQTTAEPPVQEAAEPPGTPAPAPEAPIALPAPTPAPERLPPLDDSDGFVRTAARELSQNPRYALWLLQEDLIRRFVVSVDNVAEGRTPRVHLSFLTPPGKFTVYKDQGQLRIDPASYRRYDTIAEVVTSLDAAGCAALYARTKPLIDRAYQELGYPDAAFDTRLRQAIEVMLAAPVPPESPALVEETLRYEFADPALEGLNGAQKQLLRMGPRNVQRIQGKLRELARAAGIPIRE